MSGYIGNIPVPQATQTRQSFTATASQTTFNTAGYTAGFIDVFLNGIKLVDGTDYTATNGSDVVLTTGAALDDVLDVVAYTAFDVANNTLTDATINNTLTLKNATEEDTDGGRESKITFKGEQSGGEITTLAQIQASHDGTADDEKGDLIFSTNDGSDGNTPTERLRIDADGNVGIGTSSPEGQLHLYSSSVGAPAADADDFVIEKTGDTGLSILSTTTGRIYFGDAASNDQGSIRYVHTDNSMRFETDSSERMRIDSSGNVGIGQAPSTFSGWKVLEMKGGTNGAMLNFEDNSSTRVHVLASAEAGLFRMQTLVADPITFETNNTEAMRIDSSGNLLVGTTSTSSLGSSNEGVLLRGGDGLLQIAKTGTATHSVARFYNGNGQIGSINTSGTTTSYSTSSDYRLKENVTDVTDGIARVKQLAPKRFNFIADPDTTVDGFIAHEVQDVIPEAISGAKDAMRDEEYEVTPAVLDEDGNVVTEAVMGTRSVPDYQGIDQSKLVPLLTAALQEAITKIETLETEMTSVKSRLDALENPA
jgi:hypothetical protein